jgi:hypothetical protein
MPIGTCTASLPHGGATRNRALARPDGNTCGHVKGNERINDGRRVQAREIDLPAWPRSAYASPVWVSNGP